VDIMERKTVPIEFEFKKDDISGRVFTGYASTFDVDLGGDIIHEGAFKKTLEERSSRVKILWQHDSYNPIGRPLRMIEDNKGLWIEGKISKTTLGDEALELMRDGVVDQMSIGFSIPNGKSERDEDGIRHIKEVKLFEFSPVTFPMNENAFIQSVKNAKNLITTEQLSDNDIKELSELLTDIKSLLTTEPPKSTQSGPQPTELEQLLKAVGNFGA
jgi:HK97 family phage prohead protease